MFSELLKITSLILPLSLIIGGFLLGLIFDKIILRRIRKLATRTKWEGDEIIISSLRRMPIVWFVLAGFYAAIPNLQISQTLTSTLHKILIVVAIISVTYVLSKIAVGFVRMYAMKSEGIISSTSIFANLTRILVFVIGVLIILQFLGISITPILTAFGLGGLAVALALQNTLANLFSGFYILVSRQIKPGDYIKLETGEEGYVVDISWVNTKIRELPNNFILIPNSKLASAITKNYYLPEKEMAVLVQVGVSYDSDLAKVERVTIEVAKEVMRDIQGGVSEFEPFIRYHTFADFSINFTMILRAKEFVDQYLIKHEFVKRLHKRYKQEGIEIPFPIRTLYMKQGDK